MTRYDNQIANDQSYNVQKRKHYVEYISKMKSPLIVELGVLDGSSLFTLAREAKKVGGKVIGVDIWDETKYYPGEHKWEALLKTLREMIAEEKLQDVITLERYWTKDYFPKLKDNSVDLLHIDAGHTGPEVMSDTQNYYPKVKSGGLIFWDDEGWTVDGVDTVRPAICWAASQGVNIVYQHHYAIGIKP